MWHPIKETPPLLPNSLRCGRQLDVLDAELRQCVDDRICNPIYREIARASERVQWTHRWSKRDSKSRSHVNGTTMERAPSHRRLARKLELNTGRNRSFWELPSATLGRPFRKSGTKGLNPLSSSGESGKLRPPRAEKLSCRGTRPNFALF
jgi:hypothetical protein